MTYILQFLNYTFVIRNYIVLLYYYGYYYYYNNILDY